MRTATAIACFLWCFASLAGAKAITVAADGSGDFATIGEAIGAIPTNSDERTFVHIKPGTYSGQIVLRANKTNVSFIGSDPFKTVLTSAASMNTSVAEGQEDGFQGVGVAILANGFCAENLTFENTFGDGVPATALLIGGDRAALARCRVLGWRNALQCLSRRQFFRNCYIEGSDDFIGGNATVVFDRCAIHSKRDGCIVAAMTSVQNPFGFVFVNCTLSGAEGGSTYLARPRSPYGSATFLGCKMGGHVSPQGWSSGDDPRYEATARFAEYNSTGQGANPSGRVRWAKIMTKEEAFGITVRSVLVGADGWNPKASLSRITGSIGIAAESADVAASVSGVTGEDLEEGEAEPIHTTGYVARLDVIRNRIGLESREGGKNTYSCVPGTWILAETSGSLASIPSNREISVLGKWQGDDFRFERIRSFVKPALPPEYLGENGVTGLLVGDAGTLALRTPQRLIPLNVTGREVVILSPSDLTQVEIGQRAEAWGRRVGKSKICEVLLVYGLSRRKVAVTREATPTPKPR